MKIGILIDRLNFGGVEKIALEEVAALRKIGVDASLVVLRRKGVVDNAFPDLTRKVPIIYLDDRLPRALRFSFKFPVFNFFSSFHVTYPFLLPFVVKKKEFDYFIVHGTYTSFSAASLKLIKRIRYSAFIWDPASYIVERVYAKDKSKLTGWALKKATRLADKILIKNMDSVLVGGDAHNKFIKQMSPGKKIYTIFPSVHPIKKPVKKSNYVLMVTAWKRGKNPEYLVDLVKAVPEIKIKMVGKWLEPAYRKEFEKLLKKNKLTKQIDIVGAVSEKQLSSYIAKARIVLQTNDDRGFGMPALEAAGSATTFVIPKGQGVCKMFKDKIDGYYTKEKDTEAIAKLLKTLNKNEKLATKLGLSAWEKVKANYSWEKHAGQLVKVAKANS